MVAANPSASDTPLAGFLAQNHFALFGLPERFALNRDALDAAYRAVQAQVHPDRHAQSAESSRRLAMQAAAQANEAYRTLRSPLDRAAYLCSLRGADPRAERGAALPPAFLMQQMTWREALAEADASGAEALAAEVVQARRALTERLGTLLDVEDRSEATLREAVVAVRQWMFVEKFAAEVDDALERLAD